MNTMATVFVLIMVWGGESHQSGFASINQEFNSFEACEVARKDQAKADVPRGKWSSPGDGMRLKTQGCYRK